MDSKIEHTQQTHNGTKYHGEKMFGTMAANRHHDGHLPGRKVTNTTGWQPTCPCGHDAPIVPATVLDPFMGSGTTLLVATELNRDGIGIELKQEYIEMAKRRIMDRYPLFAYQSLEEQPA